jgi:hypothetical protein
MFGTIHRSIVVVLTLLMVGTEASAGSRKNGFELEPGLIPANEIHRGGPPRDGIPAIYVPKFVKAAEQSVKADDRVLGVSVGGIAKAFPVSILAHHEVVNDWTQQTHMVVTYCPLCGSGMAFRSGPDGKAVFGVSGLLYNSDVLLYDHATESLWSQIMGKAVSGPRQGELLASLPVVHTRWSDWLARYPDTYVLSRDTGYRGINYRRMPESYRDYERSRKVWFPVEHRDNRYHPKAWVLGLQLDGVTKAYPFEELGKTDGILRDRLGDTPVVIHFADDSAWAETASGELLPAIRLFWFAWYGFHPDTLVFTGED